MVNITYKTHRIGGLFIALILVGFPLKYIFSYFNVLTTFLIFIIYLYSVYTGSLFPDIDHPTSYISRRLPLISGIVTRKFSHRGFMHSLLCIYCLIIASFLINILFKVFYPHVYSIVSIYIQTIELGFILGYLSHIFFDMLNPSGVCIFYPNTKKYRLPLSPVIKFKSASEKSLSNFLYFLNYLLLTYYLSVFIEFLMSKY